MFVYNSKIKSQACFTLSIKEREFREGNADTLKVAFGAKMVEILGHKNQTKKNDWTYSSERKNKKNFRTEFVQLHEAFQYLLKRKFLQVSTTHNIQKPGICKLQKEKMRYTVFQQQAIENTRKEKYGRSFAVLASQFQHKN